MSALTFPMMQQLQSFSCNDQPISFDGNGHLTTDVHGLWGTVWQGARFWTFSRGINDECNHCVRIITKDNRDEISHELQLTIEKLSELVERLPWRKDELQMLIDKGSRIQSSLDSHIEMREHPNFFAELPNLPALRIHTERIESTDFYLSVYFVKGSEESYSMSVYHKGFNEPVVKQVSIEESEFVLQYREDSKFRYPDVQTLVEDMPNVFPSRAELASLRDIVQKLRKLEPVLMELVSLMNDKSLQPPQHFYDMVFTHDIFTDPLYDVRTRRLGKDRHRYEHAQSLVWIRKNGTSPLTRKPLNQDYLSHDVELLREMAEWYENLPDWVRDPDTLAGIRQELEKNPAVEL